MAGKPGLRNLTGMRGRRKGGLHAVLIEALVDDAGLDAQTLRFLARLKERA